MIWVVLQSIDWVAVILLIAIGTIWISGQENLRLQRQNNELEHDRRLALDTFEWFMRVHHEHLSTEMMEQVGEAFGECVGSLWRDTDGFSDFIAKERYGIISNKSIARREFIADFLHEWNATWVEPEEVNHDWHELYVRAKELA